MKPFIRTLVFALAFCLVRVSMADTAGRPGKTVDGMEIYFGVVPAQVIAKETEKHDPKMHGGRSIFRGSHHLVVSIFDAKTGQRISDAAVVANVVPLGMGATEKKLEPMSINDTATYGNFFDFPASSAPFHITLKITRPSLPQHQALTAEFDYSPPRSQ